jgi:hypothetical protein
MAKNGALGDITDDYGLGSVTGQFGWEGYGEGQETSGQQGKGISAGDAIESAFSALGYSLGWPDAESVAGVAMDVASVLGAPAIGAVSSAAKAGEFAYDAYNRGLQAAVAGQLGKGPLKTGWNAIVGAPPNEQVMWPTSYGWNRSDPDPSESIEDAEDVLGVDINSNEFSFDPEGAWTDEQINSWNAAGQPPGMTQAQAQQLADQARTDAEATDLGYGKGYDLSQEGLGYGWGQGAADDAADEGMGFGVDSGW